MKSVSLLSLSDALRGANERAAARLKGDRWKVIDPEVDRLKRWVQSGVGSERPPVSHVREAILRFRKERHFETFNQAKLICFGCAERIEDHGYRLIEDGEPFLDALKEVDKWRSVPRLYRRCYAGLLYEYFAYDPIAGGSAGKKNWEALRYYLNARLGGLLSGDRDPDWLKGIRDHANLLSENRCGRYGLAAIDGDNTEFEDACERLHIADDSWVVREFVRSQVSAVTELGDERFEALIPTVLSLIEDHPLLLDEGLARTLERSSQRRHGAAIGDLRDFAVAHWGNPWLSVNASSWGLVSADARMMVSNWLKLHFIKQFFSLLADDGHTDDRRLKFWERYYNSITDMYFALGPSAMQSTRRDYKQLRQELKGRLLELTSPGTANNNAFIMRIGDYYAVEFGVTGNACYLFNASRLPFALVGSVAANRSALKHDRNIGRLMHIDRLLSTWESTFEAALLEKFGVSPEQERAGRRLVGLSEDNSGRRPYRAENVSGAGRPGHDRFKEDEFWRFARNHRLPATDHRTNGGALWVTAPNDDGIVAKRLEAWSFRWVERKRQWYRKD